MEDGVGEILIPPTCVLDSSNPKSPSQTHLPSSTCQQPPVSDISSYLSHSSLLRTFFSLSVHHHIRTFPLDSLLSRDGRSGFSVVVYPKCECRSPPDLRGSASTTIFSPVLAKCTSYLATLELASGWRANVLCDTR
jgi:hypothetical protein